MKAKPLPSQEVLRALLDYDPETGVLTWKPRPVGMFCDEPHSRSWNTKNAHKPALIAVTNHGYLRGTILGDFLLAHRVIWKWVHDEDPEEVDHEDGIRHHNWLKNLRSVTGLVNQRNRCRSRANTSGVTGVDLSQGRWRARLSATELGSYDTFSEAVAARKFAESQNGYHPNTDRVI
jgi:hypothetical protein